MAILNAYLFGSPFENLNALAASLSAFATYSMLEVLRSLLGTAMSSHPPPPPCTKYCARGEDYQMQKPGTTPHARDALLPLSVPSLLTMRKLVEL